LCSVELRGTTRREDFHEIQRGRDRYENRGAFNIAFVSALLFVKVEVDGREAPTAAQTKGEPAGYRVTQTDVRRPTLARVASPMCQSRSISEVASREHFRYSTIFGTLQHNIARPQTGVKFRA
jgi:hypothetical protein